MAGQLCIPTLYLSLFRKAAVVRRGSDRNSDALIFNYKILSLLAGRHSHVINGAARYVESDMSDAIEQVIQGA